MPYITQDILDIKAFIKNIQTEGVQWEARTHLLNICVINVKSGHPNMLTSCFIFQ